MIYFLPKLDKNYTPFLTIATVLRETETHFLFETDKRITGYDGYLIPEELRLNYLRPSLYHDYYELRSKLSFSSRVAIEQAEKVDPEVRTLMEDMRTAPILDREADVFSQGVQMLKDKELISLEESTHILSFTDPMA